MILKKCDNCGVFIDANAYVCGSGYEGGSFGVTLSKPWVPEHKVTFDLCEKCFYLFIEGKVDYNLSTIKVPTK